MKDKKVDRRYFISSTALAATGLVVSKDKLRAVSFLLNNKKESDLSFKIGVCDWMILKRQKLGAFERAKEIGVNGVEVDMGGLGNRKDFDNKLNDPKVRKVFSSKGVLFEP